MEQYIVSARKYRPSTFASVVGQRALTSTLKNAVATGRLAHSYLFCGGRGVGKTSCARIFAKTINCEHQTPDGEACNECDSCRQFNEGRSLNIIELDAASNNSVDDIRALVEQVQTPPSTGRYRVFIVDEVHMLSSAAFNAFLKTLEEPPSYVVFILATTEKHKIIPTILSRCQIYDFNRITVADMVDHLAYVAESEGITAERAALSVIARKADGAMRDALSIFDQVAASSRGSITYQSTIDNLNILDSEYYGRLLDCFLGGRVLETWLIYKEIRDRGFDSHFLLTGLTDYLRDLMVALSPATVVLLEADEDVRKAMMETAAKCSPEFLYKALNLLNEADINWRTASNKQFLLELTLAKICQLSGPSPSEGDAGEGQLKPIPRDNAAAGSSAAQNQPKTEPRPATQAPAPAPRPQAAPQTAQTATNEPRVEYA
ncbi:MAG: DNA polymerase III subunit gamma/tau, partial [Duncaniella sp.]|nr:DNA polymerase III subunit gamma/tau [Duncaniella sp.]